MGGMEDRGRVHGTGEAIEEGADRRRLPRPHLPREDHKSQTLVNAIRKAIDDLLMLGRHVKKMGIRRQLKGQLRQ